MVREHVRPAREGTKAAAGTHGKVEGPGQGAGSMHAAAWVDALVARSSGRRALMALSVLLLVSPVIFLLGPISDLEAREDGTFVFDTEPTSDPEAAERNVALLGEDGRATYRAWLATDLVFITLNLTAFTLAIGWSLGRLTGSGHGGRWAILLPASFAIFDLSEDGLILWLLARPGLSEAIVPTLSGVSQVKFALFGVTTLVAIGLAITVRLRRPQDSADSGATDE